MKLLALFLSASLLFAAGAPRIVFTKSFPNSVPAYEAVWVDKTGTGEYKEALDDDQPFAVQLDESETAQIFTLADKLGYFSRPLESGLKVAFTGAKTFRFEDGDRKNEVQFNYTQDVDGQVLLEWFERISLTCQHAIRLELASKYDRLGVDNALLELRASFDKKRLAGVRRLLPILDRIAKNKSAFNRDREIAAALAAEIRAGKAAAP